MSNEQSQIALAINIKKGCIDATETLIRLANSFIKRNIDADDWQGYKNLYEARIKTLQCEIENLTAKLTADV